MDNEDVMLDTPNESVESVTPPIEPESEPLEPPPVDIEQLQATNKKLYERAKKAEADLKALKVSKPAEAPASPPTNVEETVLLAQGMTDELLTELKVIAQVRKVSLIKAQTDPIFVAVKEKFEKEQKQKDASLPASRGSGNVKPKKDFKTSGLTREEHQAMVKSL